MTLNEGESVTYLVSLPADGQPWMDANVNAVIELNATSLKGAYGVGNLTFVRQRKSTTSTWTGPASANDTTLTFTGQPQAAVSWLVTINATDNNFDDGDRQFIVNHTFGSSLGRSLTCL